MPIWWDHEATKEKLFSINDLPETTVSYIDLDDGTCSSTIVNVSTSPEISGACSPVNEGSQEPTSNTPISLICDKISSFKNKFLNEVANTKGDVLQSNRDSLDILPVRYSEAKSNQNTDSTENDEAQATNRQKDTAKRRSHIKITEKRSRVSERTVSDKTEETYAKEETSTPEKRRHSAPLSSLSYNQSDRLVQNFSLTDFYSNAFSKHVNDTAHQIDTLPQTYEESLYDNTDMALDLSGTNNSAVKILSPNELNLRIERISSESPDDQSRSNEDNSRQSNGDSRYSMTSPQNTMSLSAYRSIDTLELNQRIIGRPIHVSLIKRNTGELELTLTQDKYKLEYDQLNSIQRAEVQKSLLSQNIWSKMLEHIKHGTPTQETLTLFERLLPDNERNIFFKSYNAFKNTCYEIFD